MAGVAERRWKVRIFTKVILKQSRNYEPKRVILVGFVGASAVKRNTVSGYDSINGLVPAECRDDL